MTQFTIVLPIRDTDREYNFIKKSLSSAIKLNPDEIIIGTDAPTTQRIKERIAEICKKYNFDKIRIIETSPSKQWNFQLANVIWNCYSEATHDIILSFDIDSILLQNVLLGLNQVGKNNTAVVSFTKRILIRSPLQLIRHIFYRIRVHTSDYVFSGVYFVYKPFFFDIIKLEKYQQITNGVDTLLTETILKDNKYKIITRKENGIKSLDIQNEDYPWRQFQTGLWIGANHKIPIHKQKRRQHKSLKEMPLKKLPIILITLILKKLIWWSPHTFIYIKAFTYGHPYLIKGYKWALANPNSDEVKVAKTMEFNEFGYTGSKYLPKDFKWSREGTGFV